MELIEFRPHHLAHITPPALSPELLDYFCRHYRCVGPAWTGIDQDRIVGSGGLLLYGEIGVAWAIMSQPVRTMSVHRAARRILDRAARELGLKRIEAMALANWPGGCRWLESLGFHPDHIDGEYRMYAR